jgi:DNA-binding NarL/FixJ family response regulator
MDVLVMGLDLIRQRFESLSSRQRDVSLLLIEGLTNADISQRLGVTVHTVKAHRAEVMRRMEVDSFADLVTQIQRLHSRATLSAVASSGPLRILIVEDDQWYREYLTENLNSREFIAIGVANGTEFWAAWSDQPADIVIFDIELGSAQEDGLAIASNLRSSSACGIVMATARGEMDDRLTGLGIGADAYLSKPVNINELVITLTNLGRRLR